MRSIQQPGGELVGTWSRVRKDAHATKDVKIIHLHKDRTFESTMHFESGTVSRKYVPARGWWRVLLYRGPRFRLVLISRLSSCRGALSH